MGGWLDMEISYLMSITISHLRVIIPVFSKNSFSKIGGMSNPLFLWSESWIHTLSSNVLWFVSLTHNWSQQFLVFPYSSHSVYIQLGPHHPRLIQLSFMMNLIFKIYKQRGGPKISSNWFFLSDCPPRTFSNATTLLLSENFRDNPYDPFSLLSHFTFFGYQEFLCPENIKQLTIPNHIVHPRHFSMQTTLFFSDNFRDNPNSFFHLSLVVCLSLFTF